MIKKVKLEEDQVCYRIVSNNCTMDDLSVVKCRYWGNVYKNITCYTTKKEAQEKLRQIKKILKER